MLSSALLLSLLLSLVGTGDYAPVAGGAPQRLATKDPSAPQSTPWPRSFDSQAIVATVQGRDLTLGQLLFRWASQPATERDRYNAMGGLEPFLRDVVADLLIASDAGERGLEDHPLFEQLMELRREEVLRDLWGRATFLAEIDDETLRRRWSESWAQREFPPRLHLRQILVTARKDSERSGDATSRSSARVKIRQLEQRLKEGADFARLAREASEGRLATEGGDLGWRSLAELSPALVQAAAELEPGEVSETVESEVGFHLLQLVARRPSGILPFEAVRELLLQDTVGEQLPSLGPRAREQRLRVLEGGEFELRPEQLPW